MAIFSGDDKSNQPVTEKHEVSEDYVRRQLNHAGKNLSNVVTVEKRVVNEDYVKKQLAKVKGGD